MNALTEHPHKNILIIDDQLGEHYVTELIQSFSQNGFTFDTAQDIFSAEKYLQENDYDYIILDLRVSPSDNNCGFADIIGFIQGEWEYRKSSIPQVIIFSHYLDTIQDDIVDIISNGSQYQFHKSSEAIDKITHKVINLENYKKKKKLTDKLIISNSVKSTSVKAISLPQPIAIDQISDGPEKRINEAKEEANGGKVNSPDNNPGSNFGKDNHGLTITFQTGAIVALILAIIGGAYYIGQLHSDIKETAIVQQQLVQNTRDLVRVSERHYDQIVNLTSENREIANQIRLLRQDITNQNQKLLIEIKTITQRIATQNKKTIQEIKAAIANMAEQNKVISEEIKQLSSDIRKFTQK